MGSQKVRSSMTRNVQDYLSLCARHPEVSRLGKPAFLGHAWYPVATVEMDMTEKSFEDFIPVENMILRCFRVGICQPEEIAELMALPLTYIKNHCGVLEGKGQIAGGVLTETGAESLRCQKLVQIGTHTKQRFQADAIFGILLPSELSQSAGRRFDPVEIGRKYLTIKPEEEIDKDFLEEQLRGDNLIEKYRRKRHSVLNTNVEAIHEIRFVRLDYVPVLMVWPEQKEDPLFFFRSKTSDFLPLYRGREQGETDFGNPDIHIRDLSALNKLKGPWRTYIKDLGLQEEACERFMQQRPFQPVRSTSRTYHGVAVCDLELTIRASETITLDDLTIVAAAGGNPIPVTVPVPAENGYRELRCFVPFFKDGDIMQLCDWIRAWYIKDAAKLKQTFTKCKAETGGAIMLTDLLWKTVKRLEEEDAKPEGSKKVD